MLPIDELIDTLRRLAPTIPAATLIAIENDLEAKEAEKKEDTGAAPKQKSQYVTIVLDPEGKLKDLGDFTSLIVQVPEGQDTGETLARLFQASYDQRAAAKRKTKPLTTLTEVAANLKRKFTKTHGVTLKIKEPVRVILTDGIVPTT